MTAGTAELRPIHFFDESIEVQFMKPPAREKLPDCPGGFTWNGQAFKIVEAISEWTHFVRRGRYARNMEPAHAEVAARRGSLNFGRFFFRVRTDAGRIFDIYYDRAIKNVDDHKGHWFIYRELAE